MDKIDIKSMTAREIEQSFLPNFTESFRAKQVYGWLVKGVSSFEEMSNIPQKLKDFLNQNYFIASVKIKSKKISLDGTIKYLFELYDGQLIEAVVMKYNHGYSMCLSTQVGCKMGCAFCVTGKGGFTRNLMPSEMIAQVEAAGKDENIKISNIVLMGMGEPLDNYNNVIKFLRLISSKDHLNIGMRHISLSTCGIVDKIYKLAEEKLQLTLSISLHAPNDEIRNKIMRINRRYNLKELIDACKYYIKITGRRISFEYIMIKNVNDSAKCAVELAKLLKNMICHVNLIPLNKSDIVEEFSPSGKAQVYLFQNILEKAGIIATVRRTLGKDIEAACGQLKGKYKEAEGKD